MRQVVKNNFKMMLYFEELLLNAIFLRTILCLVFSALFVRLCLIKRRKNPRFVELAEQIPGPRSLPFIGNGFDFLYNMDGKMDMLRLYEEKYGSTYRLWFGKHLVVGMADLKDLEVVFSSSKMLNKPAFMDPAREFWGDNLFLASTRLWKKSRKELQPLFTKNELLEKIPTIDQIISKYTKQIEVHANGLEFDIGKIFPLLAFDVLVEVILNASLEYVEEDYILLDKVMHEADSIFFEKMFKPWLQNSVVDYILYRKHKNYFRRQTSLFFKKIMQNQKAEVVFNQNHDGTNMKQKFGENHTTFIQLLYKIRDDLGIDDRYVQEETINLIAAGTMTTSTTLSFCILMLAMHPEIQEKLHQEINYNFRTNRRRETEAYDLDSFPYLDQVLRETERRFSLLPAIFRNVDQDVKIGSNVFPEGTAILIPVCTIHMNPKYYKNPDKFDPDHFSSDAVDGRPKLAFLPFSTGARNCIGRALAELELKLTVIELMRRFEFRTSLKMNDIDLMPGISIANREGYKVSVRMRESTL